MRASTGGEPGTSAGALRVEPAGEEEWTRAVRAMPGHSFRQTWAYGVALARRRGASSEHVLLRDGDRVVGAADVRVKRLPVLGGGLAYVSGGPLVLPPPEDETFAADLGRAIRALAAAYTAQRGFVLRIAPPLGAVVRRSRVEEEFARAGFRTAPGPGHYRTIRLDITRPVDEIRAGLTRHWRRGLSTALRHDLTISVHEDPGAIARFGELFGEFITRKGFQVDLEPAFYEEVQRGLAGEERFVTQFAEKDGQVLAGSVASFLGDTCVYLLGARSDAEQRTKASYLLHWNLILMARERGLRWYDLGGTDPVGNPGVHRFKEGTGGEDVTVPGPYEAIPRGWRGAAARGALAIYRSVRTRRTRSTEPVAVADDAADEGQSEKSEA